MTTILRSKRYDPTDSTLTIRVLTAGATDTNGRHWPKGTLFDPRSAGRDNVIGRDYQTVDIEGRQVRFER